jgi:hypothetical protein
MVVVLESNGYGVIEVVIGVIQHTKVHSCVTVCSSMLQCVTVCYSMFQCVTVCYSVFQVCRSVLLCATVCYCVLLCVGKQRLWCWRVTFMVVESDGHGVVE